MRWSELRRLSRAGWLASLVRKLHEIPASTRSDAPSRQPSLILFSLDHYAVGPGCVIVIWLVVAAIAGSIWLVCLLTFLFGRHKKSRVLIRLGGIPLILITSIALLIGGVVGFVVVRSMNPHYVYRDTFHEPPSSDVRHIRSKVWSFADEGEVFMRFEASPETFRRLVPEQMQKVSYADYKKRMPGNNLKPPVWWSAPTEQTSEIYIAVPDFGRGERFASEAKLLTYDASTNTVLYFYLGID